VATLTSTLIVRLLDKVTGPAKGVASSITGIRRAADDAGGSLSGRIQTAINRNNIALDQTRGQLLDAVGGFYLLKQGLGAAIGPAVSFESSMADVAKVSGFNDIELAAYGKRLRRLAVTEIPMAVDELAALSAAAAQGGVADAELFDFTRMTAQAAVAWEMAGSAAGDNLAKIKAQLGLTTAETALFAGAINHLSDNTASSAADLVDYARRVSAQGEFFGYTKEQTLAFGSAMVGTGAQSEVAATSFRNMGRALTKGASATKRQAGAMAQLGLDAEDVAKRMQEDAVGVTLEVIEALGQLPEHMQASVMSDLFGDEARAIAPLLNDVEILKNSLAMVADETEYASSVTDEFARRAATTEYAWQRMQNQLRDIGLTIGGSLLPALKETMGALGPIALAIADLADKHPALTKAVILTTTGLIGMRIAMIGVRFAALMARGGLLSMLLPVVRLGAWTRNAAGGAVALQTSLAAMSGAKFGGFAKVATAMGGIARAVPGIGLLAGMGKGIAVVVGALTAPAWGAVALGIGAVALAGAAINKYWDRLSAIISGVGRALSEQFAPALDAIRPALDGLAPIAQSVGNAFGTIRDTVSSAIGSISALFEREVLTPDGKAAFENAGYMAMTALLNGLKSAAGAVLDYIASLGAMISDKIMAAIRAPLGRVGNWIGIGGGDTKGAAIDGARARGGPVRRGGTYLVGEEGPELRTDLGTGRIIPHDETMRLLRKSSSGAISGGGGGQSLRPIEVNAPITIHGGGADAKEIARQVRWEIEQAIRAGMRGLHADVG
jgi:TP901 family phage tail tape measure protein